jgi:hypothetical protein
MGYDKPPKRLSYSEKQALARAEAQRKADDKQAEVEMSKGLGSRVLARGDIDRMMTTVRDAMDRGEEWLRELGYGACFIDEVALLLPEGKHGDEWYECMLGRVGQRGVTYFNQDSDVVHCQPLPSRYEVRYDFFSTDVGVRLELLRLRGGYSPLHDLYRRDGRASSHSADVVHVSFSVADEAALKRTYAEMAEKGWMLGQDCSSRYGRFGYWTKPDEGGPLLWLKPRTNLRDVPKERGGPEEDDEEASSPAPVVPEKPLDEIFGVEDDEDEEEEDGGF